MRINQLLLCAAVSVALSACGGDTHPASVDSATPTPPVDGTATLPASAFISFVQALVLSMADTQEPADTSAIVAVADDTGESVPVK
jgi:hypothetical protein